MPLGFGPPAAVTEAEYQELLELAWQQGTLEESEREIILQIISLDHRTARDVMRPRAGMTAISDDATVEEMLAAANNLEFEKAALLRDQLRELKRAVNGSKPVEQSKSPARKPATYPMPRKRRSSGKREVPF